MYSKLEENLVLFIENVDGIKNPKLTAIKSKELEGNTYLLYSCKDTEDLYVISVSKDQVLAGKADKKILEFMNED